MVHRSTPFVAVALLLGPLILAAVLKWFLPPEETTAAPPTAAPPSNPAPEAAAAAPAMEASFWDSTYEGEEFVYGKEANVHVRQSAELYLNQQPGKRIVELASGEGRNVAYLAAAGHIVTAVDFSQSGLDKTLSLAAARGGGSAAARVTAICADILGWQPASGPGSVDVVVLSFCHVRAEDRPAFMAGVVKMLKPGGLLIQEVFHPNQIHKGYREKSGGPRDVGMMVTLQELRDMLTGLGEELEGEEFQYVLEEGKHAGMGAVTRYLWRKAEEAVEAEAVEVEAEAVQVEAGAHAEAEAVVEAMTEAVTVA